MSSYICTGCLLWSYTCFEE